MRVEKPEVAVQRGKRGVDEIAYRPKRMPGRHKRLQIDIGKQRPARPFNPAHRNTPSPAAKHRESQNRRTRQEVFG